MTPYLSSDDLIFRNTVWDRIRETGTYPTIFHYYEWNVVWYLQNVFYKDVDREELRLNFIISLDRSNRQQTLH